MFDAEVVHNEPAAVGLRSLSLDLVVPGYDRPGQYVLAHVGHHPHERQGREPAFFALANDPGRPAELLIKAEPGTAAEDLARMPAGARFALSAAQGQGFPLERVEGLELVVLVNGSGISAVRPVLEAELAAGLRRPVHLFFGVLSPSHRAYGAYLERWALGGVQVTTVVDPRGAEGWSGPVGWVQEVARARGLVRADVGVVLCGLPVLLEQARALWEAAGCPPDRVLVNF